ASSLFYQKSKQKNLNIEYIYTPKGKSRTSGTQPNTPPTPSSRGLGVCRRVPLFWFGIKSSTIEHEPMEHTKELALDNYRVLQELYLMLDDSERRVLRHFELTNRQYHALQHLPPGTSRHLTEMSELLFCDKSNVTGLVERMVRDGLVTRERSEKDRRFLELKITPEGEHLRLSSRTAHEQCITKRFATLTEEEQTLLNHLLNKLAGSIRRQLRGD
ncbi:MAG: MarR family winged helix-turn-helix transcriptional regulator, partial [Ardenticatenaceae bacterium]